MSALAEIPLGGLLGTKEFDQGGPRRGRGGGVCNNDLRLLKLVGEFYMSHVYTVFARI